MVNSPRTSVVYIIHSFISMSRVRPVSITLLPLILFTCQTFGQTWVNTRQKTEQTQASDQLVTATSGGIIVTVY